MPGKYDEFEIGKEQLESMERQLNRKEFSGVYCPLKNDRSKCAVCRDVARLWSAHNETKLEQSQYREKAKKYQASRQCYMNVVFPGEPSKVKILQCGVKMVSEIVNGMIYKGWKIISPEKGASLIVQKTTDSGYNVYSPSPDFENTNRRLVDMSVVDRAYPLDDIEALRESGVEFFDIKQMEKVIKFDIIPVKNNAGKPIFYKEIWYHFNVGPSAIEEGIDDPVLRGGPTEAGAGDLGSDYESDISTFKEEATRETPRKVVEEDFSDPVIVHHLDDPPGCFGEFFNSEDTTEDGCNSEACSVIRSACEKAFIKMRADRKRAAKG